MALSSAQSGNSFIATLAENSQSAPVSALVWWIIPLVALAGGLAYAFWVSRLKSKFDNQTERSVTRFQKFQKSFQDESSQDESSQDESSQGGQRDERHNRGEKPDNSK